VTTRLSGGRLILGLGGGSSDDERLTEFTRLGFTALSLGPRAALTPPTSPNDSPPRSFPTFPEGRLKGSGP
jgi:hypothetical protein